MANTFRNKFLASNATAANAIVATTSSQTTIIGMSIANITASPILANVTITSGSSNNTFFMIYNAQIPVGSTLVPIGGDQKLVLESNDYVQIQTTGDAHVITSFVEIT
jgi:hypothetical protein